MQIVIATNPGLEILSRTGAEVPADKVVALLQSELPDLLANIDRKSPSLAVTVSSGHFAEEFGDPSIWIKVTDVPAAVHDVPVMPYDKVWRVIIDWFTTMGLLFPASFLYETGEHGMSNQWGKDNTKQYRSWSPVTPA